MNRDEFSTWYESGDKKESVILSVETILEDNGCLDCHSTDGSVIVGPSFKGIYGRTTTVFSNGKERKLVADDVYLKRSILYPDKDDPEKRRAFHPSEFNWPALTNGFAIVQVELNPYWEHPNGPPEPLKHPGGNERLLKSWLFRFEVPQRDRGGGGEFSAGGRVRASIFELPIVY